MNLGPNPRRPIRESLRSTAGLGQLPKAYSIEQPLHFESDTELPERGPFPCFPYVESPQNHLSGNATYQELAQFVVNSASQ